MNPSQSLIRPATAADAAGIARVRVQSWRESYAGIVPDAHLAAMDVAERACRWEGIFAAAETPWQAFVAVSAEAAS